MTLLANAGMMVAQGNYLDRYISTEEGFCFDVFRRFESYTGDCLEVERASDSTTLDIGFDEDDYLDVGAIETFCSGTTGRVITWYDQFPNHTAGYGGEVTKAYANAPTIYTGGAVVLLNSVAAIDFNGSTNDLRATITAISAGDLLDVSVSSRDGSSGAIISINQASNKYEFQMHRNGSNIFAQTRRNAGDTDGTNVTGSTSLSTATQYMISYDENFTDRWVFLDGVSDGNNSNNANTFGGLDTVLIGSLRVIDNGYHNGKIQSVLRILARKDSDRVSIETVINKDYGVF